MRRILVLRGGALGDFLVTLPALACLRRRWPGAHLTLAGNATAAILGREAGLVDEIISQHDRRWVPLFDRGELPAELRVFLDGFDLILSYWPDPDGCLRGHLAGRNGRRFISGPPLPTNGPAAAHYCAPLCEALGLEADTLVYPLAPSKPRPDWVALHPGSGSPTKNWPRDSWAELAAWLRAEHDARVFIVSGEAEPDGILAEAGEPWRRLPLPDLRDRLAQCRLFIGHDSGVGHLAASTGTPSVLLFGPTDPAIWAPPARTVAVLRAGRELAAITVPMVKSAVAAAWPDRS